VRRCGRALSHFYTSSARRVGGGAIPGFALWTIDRFVAVSSALHVAVEQPIYRSLYFSCGVSCSRLV